jgi:hypothetical protein
VVWSSGFGTPGVKARGGGPKALLPTPIQEEKKKKKKKEKRIARLIHRS